MQMGRGMEFTESLTVIHSRSAWGMHPRRSASQPQNRTRSVRAAFHAGVGNDLQKLTVAVAKAQQVQHAIQLVEIACLADCLTSGLAEHPQPGNRQHRQVGASPTAMVCSRRNPSCVQFPQQVSLTLCVDNRLTATPVTLPSTTSANLANT